MKVDSKPLQSDPESLTNQIRLQYEKCLIPEQDLLATSINILIRKSDLMSRLCKMLPNGSDLRSQITKTVNLYQQLIKSTRTGDHYDSEVELSMINNANRIQDCELFSPSHGNIMKRDNPINFHDRHLSMASFQTADTTLTSRNLFVQANGIPDSHFQKTDGGMFERNFLSSLNDQLTPMLSKTGNPTSFLVHQWIAIGFSSSVVMLFDDHQAYLGCLGSTNNGIVFLKRARVWSGNVYLCKSKSHTHCGWVL